MTLRAKILLKMAALLGCFGLLGSFAVWGFASLRANNGAVQTEFRELEEIREVSVRVATDKGLLEDGRPRAAEVLADLTYCMTKLRIFIAEQPMEIDVDDGPDERLHDEHEREHAERAIHLMADLTDSLKSPQAFEPANVARLRQLHNQAGLELDRVAGECARYLNQVHGKTRSTVRTVLAAMVALSAAVLAVATVVGFSLYRSIVHPLRELNDGVREMAAGHFATRLPVSGDPEFRDVIIEFNQMATQLQEFYIRLEDRVAEKSRELVRSERLASVGFLAAGVAHEIRNPLGIISGYAELSLKMLNGEASESPAGAKEARILSVIRDEAFRCKKITEKLLGLVQGGNEARQTVDMAQIVRDVTFLVRGLASFRDRNAQLLTNVPPSLCVQANPIEIKQVVLNLMLNAVDAVDVGAGQIEVRGRRIDGHVELCVRDNGCGMTDESLQHAFEPFYTSKRGRAAPGTGLGLSISHAIIAQYGGIIRAESDGVGAGSRFTIELPAAVEGRA